MHSVIQIRSLTEIFFSFFVLFLNCMSVSLSRCMRLLDNHQNFSINRTNLHSFFFSSFLLFMCRRGDDSLRVLQKWLLSCITEVIFFVYYEAFVRWLYVDGESFMTILCLRFACNTASLWQYFNNALLSLFMTSRFWELSLFFAIVQ